MVRKILLSGFDSDFLKKNKEEISRQNLNIMRISGIIFSIVLLALFVASLLSPSMNKYYYIYLSIALVSLAFTVIAFINVKFVKKFSSYILLAYIVLMLIIAILSGTYLSKDEISVIILIATIIFAICYLGPLYHHLIVFGLSTAGFIVATWFCKGQHAASWDTIDISVVYVISILFAYLSSRL